MSMLQFLQIAGDLELAGLLWTPAIGDEVPQRAEPELISVLVDPKGLSMGELRSTFLWLPTVEQMVFQFEARQAILFHAGLDLSEQMMAYKTVIQSPKGQIETRAESLRESVGIALRNLLVADHREQLH